MDINKMLDKYADWIRDEITTATFGEYTQITTPFLDHLNDYIQIYVKMNSDGTMQLTDGGYTFDNLLLSGVDMRRSPTRKQRLVKVAQTFGISVSDNEITVDANIETFPMKKHLLVQAILRIDDMFITSQSNVKSLFNDDVKLFFDTHGVFYSENLSVLGKTGSVHPYDFHFQRTKDQPERFCKTINRLNRTARDAALFSWVDTRDARSDNSTLIVLINDENTIKKSDITGFINYGVHPVLFSKLDKNIHLFAA